MPLQKWKMESGVFAAAQAKGRALMRAKDYAGAAAVFSASLIAAAADVTEGKAVESAQEGTSVATGNEPCQPTDREETKAAGGSAQKSQLMWSVDEAGANGTRLLHAKAWWCAGETARALTIVEELIAMSVATGTPGDGTADSRAGNCLEPGSALHHEVFRTLVKLTLELLVAHAAAASTSTPTAADPATTPTCTAPVKPTQGQLDAALAACKLIAPSLLAKGREGTFELVRSTEHVRTYSPKHTNPAISVCLWVLVAKCSTCRFPTLPGLSAWEGARSFLFMPCSPLVMNCTVHISSGSRLRVRSQTACC